MKLGELLIENNLLDQNQLKLALEHQNHHGGKLGTNLIELGMITDEQLALFLSEQLKIPCIHKHELDNIPDELINMIPRDFVERHHLIAYKMDQKLYVALCDPSNLSALDKLQFLAKKQVVKSIAPEVWVVAALERYYGVTRLLRDAQVVKDDESIESTIIRDISMTYNDEFTVLNQPEVNLDIDLNKFVSELIKLKSPIHSFQLLFTFINAYFDKMAILRINQEEIKGWILSGIAKHVNQFQDFHLDLKKYPQFLKKIHENKNFTGQNSFILPNELALSLEFSQELHSLVHMIFLRSEPKMIFVGQLKSTYASIHKNNQLLLDVLFHKVSFYVEMLYLKRKIFEGTSLSVSV